MSYFCGIIENEVTNKGYKYLVNNHVIQKRYCDWGLDGITFPRPSSDIELSSVINSMNEYVRKETGLNRIAFVVKSFDDVLYSVIQARKALVVADQVDNNSIVAVDLKTVDELFQNPDILDAIISDDNEGATIIYNAIKDKFKL